jgi:hypothetical protein
MTAAEVVTRAIDALDRLQIPYMTVGSFSSNVYGTPRSTKDADFVLALTNHSINALLMAIGKDFQLEPQMSFETITATSRWRIKHRDTAFVVELFLLSDDPHDRTRFARRVHSNIGGRQAFVPTAEDVVITKLRWSRLGKRQKDSEDVLNVLRVQQGKLDLDYIRHWCDQHGTRELFEQLLIESQEIS